MSEDKFHNNPKIQDECSCSLNYLGLWSQCEIDRSLPIEEEIQEAINQPIEEKNSKPTKKVVPFNVLTILALLGAATALPSL